MSLPAAASDAVMFVSALKEALQDERDLFNSKEFRRALLWDEQDDFTSIHFADAVTNDETVETHNEQDSQDPPFLLKGLPKRPLYIELGNRLCLLSSHKDEDIPLFLPAQHFGFAENATLSFPSHHLPADPSKRSMKDWINRVGTPGILSILGMRDTIGTDSRGLLPPPWNELLEAASQPFKPSRSNLSVAARARAKHAHRGAQQHFFGTVVGPVAQQNKETLDILVKLLENAAWINIHSFGGTEGGEPFLEVRVASGYGARWRADWTSDPVRPRNVSFRGFLEPQMPDGHERRWRH